MPREEEEERWGSVILHAAREDTEGQAGEGLDTRLGKQVPKHISLTVMRHTQSFWMPSQP